MKTSDTSVIRAIAAFKLLKAALLIAVGIAALRLVHSDLAVIVARWVLHLGLDPGSRYVGRASLKAATLTPSKIMELAVGSFIYAALFIVEGIGLWWLKNWAMYFSIIITTSLVPLEIYEIHRHLTVGRILVLLVNIAVVLYLFHQLRSRRPHP